MEIDPVATGTRFLDVRAAAALLGISPKTLYNWVSQRRIPYRKAGRRLLFLEVELVEWTQPRGCMDGARRLGHEVEADAMTPTAGCRRPIY